MNPTILALLRAGVIDLATAERLDRQLDPTQARAWAEQLLTQRYASGLSAQQSRLVDFLQANQYRVNDTQVSEFFANENRLLSQSIADAISEVVNERATIAAVTAGLSDPFDFVNRQLLAWVDDYYINLDIDDVGTVGQLNATARSRVAQAFREWYNGELGGTADGLPQLIRALEPTFGAARAEAIGVTEVTRIFVGMQRAAEAENPNVTSWRWQTANDELVCPICRPLNGAVIAKTSDGFTHPERGNVGYPPAHVRCRCGITPETELTAGVGNIFEAISNGRR